MVKIRTTVILAVMAAVFLAACNGEAAETTEGPAEETPTIEVFVEMPTVQTAEATAEPTEEETAEPTPTELTLTSTAFENGGEIPERYGYYRDNVSPPMTWAGVPGATQTLVLIMEDRFYQDAPEGPPCHWMLYRIPRYVNNLPEGVPAASLFADTTAQAPNLNGDTAYAGPYPPPGEIHEYAFTLYALNTIFYGLPLTTTCGEVRQILAENPEMILASTELVGWYEGVAQ